MRDDEAISCSLIHLHPDQEDRYCTRSECYEFASPQNYFNGDTGAFGESFAGDHFEKFCLRALPIAGTVQGVVSFNDSTL
jgi:hypothetical protein